jgi:hypothetical protein
LVLRLNHLHVLWGHHLLVEFSLVDAPVRELRKVLLLVRFDWQGFKVLLFYQRARFLKLSFLTFSLAQ